MIVIIIIVILVILAMIYTLDSTKQYHAILSNTMQSYDTIKNPYID